MHRMRHAFTLIELLVVGMGDGSVRGVASSISFNTWQSVVLPDDRTIPGPDW